MLDSGKGKQKSYMNIYWVEIVRLICQKRWLVTIPVFFLITWLEIDFLHVFYEVNYKMKLNVWDGVFGTLYDSFYFRFVVIMLFVFFVTDTILKDMDTCWLQLSMTRCQNPLQWWKAKVVSIFASSLLYMLIGTGVLVFTSSVLLPFEMKFSDLTLTASKDIYMSSILDVPTGVSPVEFLIQYMLYTVFSIGVFSMIPVTFSLFVRNKLPILFTLCWLLASHFFFDVYMMYHEIDIIPRLMYGVHFSNTGSLSLSISLIYLTFVGIAMYFIGAHATKHMDF